MKQFDTNLAARALVFLGSLIVRGKMILRCVIHDFHSPFLKLTK